MTDEYIRKQDAINIANDWLLDCFKVQKQDRSCGLIRKLEDSPPADVAPVVHAKWENYSPVTIKCSRCGHVIHDWRYSECKYCPNCGAKMDAQGEE